MCGLYYPHPSNTIFTSKEIKDDAEGENAYEENEDKLQVKKKISLLTLESPPDMVRVCR